MRFPQNNPEGFQTELILTGPSVTGVVAFVLLGVTRPNQLPKPKKLSMSVSTGFIDLSPNNFCVELRADLTLQAFQFEFLGQG